MNCNARAVLHLENGGLLLTPDLRQSRIFRRLHDRDRIAAGKRVWPSAQVMPLETWLQQIWREAGAMRGALPQPLPAIALRWLWRREAVGDMPGLLDPAELGARARTSWLRLQAYGGRLEDLARYPMTRDQQAFVGWAVGAETGLRERGACDAADLARLLVESDALPAPGPRLLLAGFRRMTPAQSALFAALAARGWSIERLEPEVAADPPRQFAAADPESERGAMLACLRAQFELKPDGLHALIAPGLSQQRGAWERALAASLQPELELPAAGRHERVFDLAGGDPLSSQPVVESALTAIAALFGPMDAGIASRLLRSPYLSVVQNEQASRLRLDVELRRAGWSLASPPGIAARAAAGYAPQFAAAIAAAIAASTGPLQRTAGDWAECFGACLGAWGWPGEVVLGSEEYQAARHFQELLRELAALASVAPEMQAPQALDELRRLTAAPFQPESGEPAVFVLDGYEGSGVRFDSLWVSGLTAAAWPRPVTVDPLLPIEIQRRLGMPCVTADGCVEEARAIIGHWRAQAGLLVLSWPQRENDMDADVTPLIPADAIALAPPAPVATRERLAFAATALEAVPDDQPPPLAGAIARGGARMLELQSHCPFRAYAQLRLGAEPLEEPEPGIDRRLRGTILHRALQRLWTRIGSQRALLRLDEGARETRISDAIDRSLAELLPAAGAAATLLERDWQRRAIANLLELERVRPDFTVVETERELAGRIGGLELSLRVDRIDRVGDELVVIDYKGGAIGNAPWRGARMDAPQLPLYAVLHPDRPSAIAVALLRAGEAAFVGISREAGVIEGLQPAARFKLTEDREDGFEWAEIKTHWYAWLERLAEDHAAGRAEVDPKLGPDTCRHCHLGALCRVAAVAPEESDAAEGGHGD
ncbi:MAG: PD-(D/E)XK nuclease family protein [Steroidobacteraceae bacterium]